MIMSNHQGTSGPHESENFVDVLNLPGYALHSQRKRSNH
uniref:RIKEN cDNA 1700006A11 gene n=1 Tax=Mus musculus TaxID=10090 RepID=A0A0G2JFV6_MOUSE